MAAVSPRANALPGPATIYPWYDTSGKGDDGNNTSGGARYGSAGGGSFTFNGTSNYVSSDDKANLQLGSGNFTLAAWIKPANPVPTPYGYFGGGRYPSAGNYSIVDRVDYDNDTATASARGNLSGAQKGLGATGNTSYGYIAGNTPGSSLMDRLDYSSDTSTAAAKGPLSAARYGMGAAGNASYGYFGGGRSGPSRYTTVDRLDYSSDSTTCVVKGPLTSARQYLAATGDTSYGYIAGGFTSSSYLISTIDRVDYSNDTVTAVTKGPLSTGRAVTAGASPKANALSGRSDNEGIISYSDTAGEQNDTTCQLDTNSDGKIKFSGAAGIVTSTSAIAADTWAHAAVTRTDNTISVYVNGVLENTGITTHTFSDYAKVTIGANRPRSTFYKGDISQVQIYKKALSSDDIQQNFRSLKKRFGL